MDHYNESDSWVTFVDTALVRKPDHPICHNKFGCGAFVAQNADSDILFARNDTGALSMRIETERLGDGGCEGENRTICE